MSRSDKVLEVLRTERRQDGGGRPLYETELLECVRASGDSACTPMALRMILRGLGDYVRNPKKGPLGLAMWEAR